MSTKCAVSIYQYATVSGVTTGYGEVTAAYSASGTSITPQIGAVPKASGLGDCRPLFFYNYDGNRRALVAIRNDFGATAATMRIYDPGDISASTTAWTLETTLTAPSTCTNIFRIVRVSATLLALIDYDSCTVFTITMATGDSYTVNSSGAFTFATSVVPSSAPSGSTVLSHAMDIQVDSSGNLYALFISGVGIDNYDITNTYYNKSTVAKLTLSGTTITLDEGNYVGPYGSTTGGSGTMPAENAFAIQPYTSGSNLYFILTAIGGPQQHTTSCTCNDTSRVQKVLVSSLTVTDILTINTAAAAGNVARLDFRAVAFNSAGTDLYVLVGDYNAAYGMKWFLRRGSLATLMSAASASYASALTAVADDTTADGYGYLWTMAYSNSISGAWFACGNQLDIYQAGEQKVTMDITSLNDMTYGTKTTADSFLDWMTIYDENTASASTLIGYQSPMMLSSSATARAAKAKFLKKLAK